MQKRWAHGLRAGRGTGARGVLRWLVAGVLTVALAPQESRAACGDFGLPDGSEIVEFETALGSICLELLREDAPLTVQNFVNYVEDGDYDGTVVHRSASNFVIQGGGFEPVGNALAPIPTDAAVPNEPCTPDTPSGTPGVMVCSERGSEQATVAMAKLGGEPNSATSQWFINLADNRETLDNQNGGFTVFARVLGDTFSVAEAIEALPIADQVVGFFLGPANGSAFGSLPLHSPVPALESAFGCWNPSAMSMMLTFDFNGPVSFAAQPDPVTGGVSFLSSACGGVVAPWPAQIRPATQLPCSAFGTSDLLGAAVLAPFQRLATVAAVFPPLARIPIGFDYTQFFIPDPMNPFGFQGYVIPCEVVGAVVDLREAWRADLWNRASPEFVLIEQATYRVVPEPGAAAGVAAFAALGLLVRRRARRS